MTAADRVLDALRERGLTLAVAESLTGGLIAATLTAVPGSSAVVRGGVVAYATDLKVALLDVDADLVARHGAVHADVAAQMAAGVARVLEADVGVACTGVAGPDPQDGQPAGVVFVAAIGPGGARVLELALPGDRAAVREATVREALELVLRVIG